MQRQRPYGTFPSRRPKVCEHTHESGVDATERDGPHKRFWGPCVATDGDEYGHRTTAPPIIDPNEIKNLPNHDNRATIELKIKASQTSRESGKMWWVYACPKSYGTATLLRAGGFDYTLFSQDMDIDGVEYRVYWLVYPLYSSLSVEFS